MDTFLSRPLTKDEYTLIVEFVKSNRAEFDNHFEGYKEQTDETLANCELLVSNGDYHYKEIAYFINVFHMNDKFPKFYLDFLASKLGISDE